MEISPALRTLLDALADPTQPVSSTLVADLEAEAPCFTLPSALRLTRHADTLEPDELRSLQARVALSSPTPENLMTIAGSNAETWRNFYPADNTPSRPDTNDAISTFLETYGHGASDEDDALLERLILNPQPDYASVLEKEYAADTPTPDTPAADTHMAMIDAFLASPEPSAPREPVTPAPEPAAPVNPSPAAKPAHDSPLGESLAKIYIRQHRYAKAYEIISNLNLNFPEKSAYFADQLRFLQKLIMLEQRSNASGKQT